MFRQKRIACLVVWALLGLLGVFVQETSASAGSVINVVSLGDSYTSGNGAKDYYGPAGCYRSRNNYSEQYVARLRSVATVNYTNLACSGATTDSIAGQIAENPAAVKDADLIFVSIGGNDADFAGIAVSCFHGYVADPMPCFRKVEGTWGKISGIVAKTVDAMLYIKRQTPSARIVLVGYPYLVADCDYTLVIPNEITGASGRWGLGDQLRMLQQSYEGMLKQQVELSVYGLNLQFVSLRGLYAGHEMCSGGEEWIVPMYSSLTYMEYLHPNTKGHSATGAELYNLNVHTGLVGGSDGLPSVPQQAPAGSYANLPFACAVKVPYVSTYDNYGGFSHGYALDMPISQGTPVVSPVRGAVSVYYEANGYGRYVDVTDSSGTTHRFAHLQMAVNVSGGQQVARGQVIGNVGVTGATTGPHLHYEQRRGGVKVLADLGGPGLRWGKAQDSSGFKTTSHPLISGNCTGTAASQPRGNADLMIWERTQLRYARSNGRTYSNWEPFAKTISNPALSDSCEFDGDRFTEYVSYEENLKQFAIGNPSSGSFGWDSIVKGVEAITGFVCVDWNGDGLEDIFARHGNTKLVVGISNGTKVAQWVWLVGGIGPLSHLDACDVNGDGRDEVVAYEPGIFQLRMAVRTNSGGVSWQQLLPGIGPIKGLACGNFNASHAGDEVIVWQPEQNGRYVMGEFNSNYSLRTWTPLTPTGLGAPFRDEIAAGDIDGDGQDELVVNEFRVALGSHSIMVGDFTSAKSFRWYPFIEGITAQNMEVGYFVD